MELCLGTVQFGLDYGIRGRKKPSVADAVSCLEYAVSNGIYAIDTAAAYGAAEDIVGLFLKKNHPIRENLFISSKVPPNVLDGVPEDDFECIILENLKKTLIRLNTEYLDAYLFHSARYAFNPAMLNALHSLKRTGLVMKTGISVYEPEEANASLASPHVDFMQLPSSIFDQRMLRDGVLGRVDKSKIQIHNRSVFLQGLLLMSADSIPEHLSFAIPMVKKFTSICQEYNVSKVAAAMDFVRKKCSDNVSHLVFGVDSIDELQEDIALFQKNIPVEFTNNLMDEFKDLDKNIVMPSLWQK